MKIKITKNCSAGRDEGGKLNEFESGQEVEVSSDLGNELIENLAAVKVDSSKKLGKSKVETR